jgi:Ca2+-binding EF-hand superfamily protein
MKYIVLAGVLLAFAGLASAQAGGADRRAEAEARFDQADKNKDGKLSLAEMQDAQDQRLAERFAKLDANQDGGVSKDEFRQAHEQQRAERQERKGQMKEKHQQLMALDADKDGAFTRAELGDKAPRLAENFDRIDANKDGKITREEMQAMRASK